MSSYDESDTFAHTVRVDGRRYSFVWVGPETEQDTPNGSDYWRWRMRSGGSYSSWYPVDNLDGSPDDDLRRTWSAEIVVRKADI